MLISVAAQAAEPSRATISVDGQPYQGVEYIGRAPKPGTAEYGTLADGEAYPQAYLVVQPPQSHTRPHFHQTNQFQVFVAGDGTLGKVPAVPYTVQFAGGHTPYGPIQAGATGVSYFTLRQTWDSGAKYMPERRDQLERGRQRQRVGTVRVPEGDGPQVQPVIEPEDDGLLALAYALPPGGSALAPDAAEGGGQYHLVIGGSLLRDGQELPPLSMEFAFPEDGAVRFEAGAGGLRLLLLRFPRLGA